MHVLSSQQFTPKLLGDIFLKSDEFREKLKHKTQRRLLSKKYQGEVLASLFYEPSTRTRLSFEAAAHRLGLGVLSTENARISSSAMKGESLEDSVQVVSRYVDIIVLRHSEIGAADRAARFSTVPIVNAGDGGGEHPTQMLLDLYTIWRKYGRLDHLTLGIGFDPKHSRALKSLLHGLSLFKGNSVHIVAPRPGQLSSSQIENFRNSGLRITTSNNVEDSYAYELVYVNRFQAERFNDPSATKPYQDAYRLTAHHVKASKIKYILHPLPRVKELDPEVDQLPQAIYFEQAENGLYVRMALIDRLLSARL